MNPVQVYDIDDRPLMPCKPAIARLLLKEKKAIVRTKEPFTIRVLHSVDFSEFTENGLLKEKKKGERETERKNPAYQSSKNKTKTDAPEKEEKTSTVPAVLHARKNTGAIPQHNHQKEAISMTETEKTLRKTKDITEENFYLQFSAYYKSNGYNGYNVKYFDIEAPSISDRYNPMRYIKSDRDIYSLVQELIKHTSTDAQMSDGFMTKCETAILCALIAYVWHFQPEECQNFSTVIELLKMGMAEENGAEMGLENIFAKIRREHPDSYAVLQYDTFKLGAGQFPRGILLSCAVRLQLFNLVDAAKLTDSDSIGLDNFSQRTALFVHGSKDDDTYRPIYELLKWDIYRLTNIEDIIWHDKNPRDAIVIINP